MAVLSLTKVEGYLRAMSCWRTSFWARAETCGIDHGSGNANGLLSFIFFMTLLKPIPLVTVRWAMRYCPRKAGLSSATFDSVCAVNL